MNIWSWIDHIIPSRCLVCGAPAATVPNLCAGCLGDLPLMPPACRRCAGPLPHGQLCGPCMTEPPEQERTVAALSYTGVSVHLIHRFKFRGDLAAGALLASLMGMAVAAEPRPDCLVPVPLSPGRLRQRGFDQALELARLLSRWRGVTLDARCARRTAERVPQSSLARWEQRRANVRGVFHVEPQAVLGRRVCLVDDVLTSGSTARALARLMLAAGAARVDVWVACRAAAGP